MGQTASPATERPLTWNDDPYYIVCIGVHKSRRYHAKMRALYQGLNSTVLGANAVLGAGAFMALLGGRGTLVAQVLIGIVAAGSALDTVFGFAKKAKLHDDLCRRFTELAAKMVDWQANDINYRKACSERLRIEKDEPTERRLIDLQARNDELRSRGYPPDELVPLSRPQRWLGYFFTFDMERLERWKKERQTKLAAPNDKTAAS